MPQSESKKEQLRKYAQSITAKFQKLQTARSNWEIHWQECLDYIIPRKNDVIVTRMPGEKRGQELFDTTAIQANQLLAGALHGMLTNPAVRFFDLVMGDPTLDNDEEVKFWLQDSGDRMFNVMNNTNFQTEVHEIYIDQGAIGTACLFMGEHDERVVHFSARSIKEIFVDENNLGLIDTVYRLFKWKPRQIVMEFGEENVPEEILRLYENNVEDPVEIVHVVHPMDKDEENNPKKYEFKSCYVAKDMNLVISESGFREFPYAVPRWTKTSGEIYGRGPGMDMLPDIKMVNVMMETVIKGAQKTIDPPLMVADDGVIGKVRLTPGGLTVVRPTMELPIRPLISDARIDFGYQAVEDVRKRIRAGFYVDQLQLNEGPQMTATEVMQRTEEKLRLMGPVLGRQHFEFLRPVIERVFGIMVRRGLIDPAPKQIQGKKFDVRYSSLVARAQRMSEGQNLSRAIGVAAPVIQADPKVLDNINGDQALKYVFEVYGIPHKLLRTENEVGELRKSRADAQQQAMEQQSQMQQADMAGKALPGMAQVMQASKGA